MATSMHGNWRRRRSDLLAVVREGREEREMRAEKLKKFHANSESPGSALRCLSHPLPSGEGSEHGVNDKPLTWTRRDLFDPGDPR